MNQNARGWPVGFAEAELAAGWFMRRFSWDHSLFVLGQQSIGPCDTRIRALTRRRGGRGAATRPTPHSALSAPPRDNRQTTLKSALTMIPWSMTIGAIELNSENCHERSPSLPRRTSASDTALFPKHERRRF